VSILAEYRDLRVTVEPPFDAVTMTLRAPVPAGDAWRAITSPPQLRRWLGTLWSVPAVGVTTRLDFGDGDFFVLGVERLEAPRTFEYDWRFHGISPSSRITWTVRPVDECACEVVVRDRQQGRPRDESLILAAGWADFLERLTRFLATGTWSRYDWRSEVEVSVELAVPLAAARSLLDEDRQAEWLPLSGHGLVAGTTLAVEGESPLRIDDLDRLDEDTMRFAVGGPERGGATRCQVQLRARTQGVLLEVRHAGFRELALDEGQRKLLRAHVARTWVAALERARAAAVSPP
jgi:uncharacterized protein YndB with AHSA1/START domain